MNAKDNWASQGSSQGWCWAGRRQKYSFLRNWVNCWWKLKSDCVFAKADVAWWHMKAQLENGDSIVIEYDNMKCCNTWERSWAERMPSVAGSFHVSSMELGLMMVDGTDCDMLKMPKSLLSLWILSDCEQGIVLFIASFCLWGSGMNERWKGIPTYIWRFRST